MQFAEQSLFEAVFCNESFMNDFQISLPSIGSLPELRELFSIMQELLRLNQGQKKLGMTFIYVYNKNE